MAHSHTGKNCGERTPPGSVPPIGARDPMSSSGADISKGRACKMKDAGIRLTHYKFD